MSLRTYVALLIATPVLVACGQPAPPRASAPPSSTASPSSLGPAVPHALYTHCGIWETRFEGQYWATSPAEPEQTGSAPEGWDDPVQHGTMRRLSSTQAEFRDGAGHVVVFRLRSGATGFQRICS